jgi:hypothetical protein
MNIVGIKKALAFSHISFSALVRTTYLLPLDVFFFFSYYLFRTCTSLYDVTFMLNFDVQVAVHCDKFLIIELTRCTNFSFFFKFWNETLHVSDCSSVHHQEFSTVHIAVVYVIQVCWQLASRIRMEFVPSWSCLQAVSKPVWHIPLLCVQWKTRDDGQRNCPKHVEFHSKNKKSWELSASSCFYYKECWTFF